MTVSENDKNDSIDSWILVTLFKIVFFLLEWKIQLFINTHIKFIRLLGRDENWLKELFSIPSELTWVRYCPQEYPRIYGIPCLHLFNLFKLHLFGIGNILGWDPARLMEFHSRFSLLSSHQAKSKIFVVSYGE